MQLLPYSHARSRRLLFCCYCKKVLKNMPNGWHSIVLFYCNMLHSLPNPNQEYKFFKLDGNLSSPVGSQCHDISLSLSVGIYCLGLPKGIRSTIYHSLTSPCVDQTSRESTGNRQREVDDNWGLCQILGSTFEVFSDSLKSPYTSERCGM